MGMWGNKLRPVYTKEHHGIRGYFSHWNECRHCSLNVSLTLILGVNGPLGHVHTARNQDRNWQNGYKSYYSIFRSQSLSLCSVNGSAHGNPLVPVPVLVPVPCSVNALLKGHFLIVKDWKLVQTRTVKKKFYRTYNDEFIDEEPRWIPFSLRYYVMSSKYNAHKISEK